MFLPELLVLSQCSLPTLSAHSTVLPIYGELQTCEPEVQIDSGMCLSEKGIRDLDILHTVSGWFSLS